MRLIDLDEFLRETCINRIEGESCEDCNFRTLEVSCEELLAQPTIDPVKHGRWIKNEQKSKFHIEPVYICSCCREQEAWGQLELSNYCPNCGAKMDEVER